MRQDKPRAALQSYLAAAEINSKSPDLQSNLFSAAALQALGLRSFLLLSTEAIRSLS